MMDKEEKKKVGEIATSVEIVDYLNKLLDYLFIRQKLLLIDETNETELKIYFELSELLVKEENELWDEIVKLLPDYLTKERTL